MHKIPSNEDSPNGAVTVLQAAVASGASVCFANPGTTEMPLVGALDQVDGMRRVCAVRH